MTTSRRFSLSLLVLLGCNFADREENYRPFGGAGGVGGSMDSSVADDSGDDGDGGNVPFSKQALLIAAGQCVTNRYAEFVTLMEVLTQATAEHGQEPTATTRTSAQTAFRHAMAAWQRAELFQIGPAARSTSPGGQGLRDQIYFFPANNACLVDQQLVSERYALPTFPSSLASARGLGALEYLLFHTDAGNNCPATQSINTAGTWAELSPAALEQRRADYAHAAALDVLARARALVIAWEPSGGNFIAQFTSGSANGAYATEQDALTALMTAIFYLDEGLKDPKLAIPLALPLNGVIDCPDGCPERLESPFARISADNIRENLIAFRQVFQGCGTDFGGMGIDDWLRSIGQEDVAARMLAALDHADATVNALGSLEDAAIENPPTRARALHAAIKAITDLFKTDLVMVLNVQLPTGVGGDVD